MLRGSAGSAGTASPSTATAAQPSIPSQSASASTAQQIQATGPAAVAAVRALQATAVATADSHPQSASVEGDQAEGDLAQSLGEEPPAGTGRTCMVAVVHLG